MIAHVNGIDLAFDDVAHSGANDPPVLLIHGFPLNRRMWSPQIEALSGAGYRVIAPDLRGFGDSPVGEVGDSGAMDILADDLVALLDHLGIEQAVVAGMSMGGYVLLNLAARAPERMRAACFLVTRADADDETARGKRDHLIGEIEGGNPISVADAFIQVLFAENTPADRPGLVDEVYAMLAATNPAGLLLGLRSIRDRDDSTELLPGLNLPSLVVGARNDRAIPLERSEILAALVPGARLTVIENAGHMANLEQPGALNESLLAFLQSLS